MSGHAQESSEDLKGKTEAVRFLKEARHIQQFIKSAARIASFNATIFI